MSILHRTLDENVAYPPHEPRKASAIYVKTHHHLVYELDAPCWTCGIRHSDGGALETHHFHFEWASINGLDLGLVTKDWPALTDRKALADWVDGELNMLVLCAIHHRAQNEGIHEITYPAWLLQRYQGHDFTFIQQQLATTGPVAKVPLLAKATA